MKCEAKEFGNIRYYFDLSDGSVYDSPEMNKCLGFLSYEMLKLLREEFYD